MDDKLYPKIHSLGDMARMKSSLFNMSSQCRETNFPHGSLKDFNLELSIFHITATTVSILIVVTNEKFWYTLSSPTLITAWLGNNSLQRNAAQSYRRLSRTD